MSIFRNNLAVVFITRILVLLVIIQGFLGFWYFNNQKTGLFEGLKGKIELNGELLKSTAVTSIMSYDFTFIQTMTYELVRDEEIISINVVDTDGNIISEKKGEEEDLKESGGLFFVPEKNIYSSDIMSSGKKLGGVWIVYSGKRINEVLSKALYFTLVSQFIVFIGLVVLIAYLFRLKVGKRIDLIQEKVEIARQGDLSVAVPGMEEDEIGLIAKGLNFLVESLSSTIDKIKGTANNVFRATKQFKEVFDNVTQRVEDQKKSTDEVAEFVDKANQSQIEIAENTEGVLGTMRESVSSIHEMRAAVEEVSSSASKLFASTEVTHSSVDEMTQQAKNIKERATGVMSAIQETSASVEEITASLQEVKHGARESSTQVEKVTSIISGVGKESVDGAIKGMEEIEAEMGRAADILSKLRAHSKDIEKILKVISEITEKANLLSLNAAIVSSQAGEYGKSFSVIADEMGTLSEKTESSTKDIAEIIKIIQSHIQETDEAFKVEIKKVEKGHELVRKVGETLEAILKASVISSEMARKIDTATDEEAAGLMQIMSSLETIKSESELVNIAVSEQYKGISYLLENAVEVKEIAEVVNRAISEQAGGIELITKNIDIANEKLTGIAKSNLGLSEINEMIIGVVKKIQESGDESLKGVHNVSTYFVNLKKDVETLNEDMKSFRLKEGS